MTSFWRLPGRAAVFAGFFASVLAPAQADIPALASLSIHVDNVDPRGGVIRLGLYDAASYSNDKAEPTAGADVRAEPRETLVTLHNLQPGTYAIEVYQDINANDKMDTNWLGLPLEPFGFSRDARPHLRKPRFRQVEFTLLPGENVQTLHLQSSISLIAAE